MDSVEELAERARAANFVNPNTNDMRPIRFVLADTGYFRLATVVNHDGESWHNYALCRQIAFKDYEGAEEAYINAVIAAPHDKRIIKNFNLFLRRCRGEDPRTGIDAYEKMRLYQVTTSDGRYSRNSRAVCAACSRRSTRCMLAPSLPSQSSNPPRTP